MEAIAASAAGTLVACTRTQTHGSKLAGSERSSICCTSGIIPHFISLPDWEIMKSIPEQQGAASRRTHTQKTAAGRRVVVFVVVQAAMKLCVSKGLSEHVFVHGTVWCVCVYVCVRR